MPEGKPVEGRAARRQPSEWRRAETSLDAAAALEAAGYPARLARMLARRGVGDAESARAFLEPTVEDLHDPFLLDGMDRAVERLLGARDAGEIVAIVGDYDVDGVTATAMLMAVFGACGLEARPILPHRMRDGYGFQNAQVESAKSLDARVIVTADCGSHSHEAVGRARDAGLDVIITDHHLPGDSHGPEVVHINPHRERCSYPFGDLSGAGLALKLAIAFSEKAGRPIDPLLLLRVAALGTIADMVPLEKENRTIAALGLESLAETRSVGLRALMNVAGISGPVKAGDVGFRIGPRINAAGRMDSPDAALELLLTRDAEVAANLARQLDDWNGDRQRAEAQVVEDATALFADEDPLPPVLVGWREGWHRGVVGIAAGRLSRQFHRPTILLSVEGESATGSGRSIRDVHLHDFLLPWKDRLERFGGHSQAIGLTAAVDSLEALQAEWIEAATAWDPSVLVKRLRYEEDVSADEVNDELLAEVRRLEPFGIGNPRPVFRIGPLRPATPIRRFGGTRDAPQHVSLGAADDEGRPLQLVGWRWCDRADELQGEFELLGQVAFDRYLGKAVVEIVDVRPVEATA